MADKGFAIPLYLDFYDKRSFIGWSRFFGLTDDEMRVAAWRSINRTLKHMRSVVSKKIRARYYVKKAVLDKGIEVEEADMGSELSGWVSFTGFESPPLSKFDPQVRYNKKGNPTAVSVRVLKVNRRRYLKPGGKHKIVVTSKGRAAVWMAKGQVMARTEDSPKKPIVLYGPSFMAFFRLPGVAESLWTESERYFRKQLAHQVDWYYRHGVRR